MLPEEVEHWPLMTLRGSWSRSGPKLSAGVACAPPLARHSNCKFKWRACTAQGLPLYPAIKTVTKTVAGPARTHRGPPRCTPCRPPTGTHHWPPGCVGP